MIVFIYIDILCFLLIQYFANIFIYEFLKRTNIDRDKYNLTNILHYNSNIIMYNYHLY